MLSAEKLKFLRLLHNISQKDLGAEMGISKNYISMIENRKEGYSQDWHDRYVKAVYKIAEMKKNEKNIEKVEEIKEEIKKTKTKKK
ncbi:helix-turn-helix transcriptional regulator [Clostridium sporogenes]|uniref:helix-turn-helix domain-containing protein n=1 Tax=Clostridium sporogenes TaxID=1509 RepID=UPI0013C871C7|nr:helix-turn-helix transcriptional regulator [Clostridium sporogenes]NFQ02756.1 helix-turn-helix transcriptional regulator [Clostridium sporogenes]NFQ41614.1 helix-turn-helix transcriptional regulator [Clostridium sporogenes]NFT02942.1 helix-turn-helix transcriptional regulator [Clostridium sporogenes]NFT32897.1 helix-turn-helix transcriptional regulator [Clostridium sporogenes]NFT38430.1 helix-turn-helix transcriptional regulator [Clostridium sporogenes]